MLSLSQFGIESIDADSDRVLRIAVFTDVHANLAALNAVLDDIEKRGPYDLIVSAGDQLSGGPRPLQTWQELRANEIVLLKGDTERDLVLGESKPVAGNDHRRDLILTVFDWTLDLVPDDIRQCVEDLPEELRREASAGQDLLVTHANGVNLDDFIWADTPPAELERLLGHQPPKLMVVGHIHAPLEMQVLSTRILRPGSVGLKYESRWADVAHWADIRWDPSQNRWDYVVHSVRWDLQLELDAAREFGYPGTTILPGFDGA